MIAQKRLRPALALKGLAGLLWLGSLALPAVRQGGSARGGYSGLDALLLGWMGPMAGMWGWFANPLMAAAAAPSRPMDATAASLALGLALSSLAHPQVCWDDRCHPARLAVGAGVWIASAATLLAATLFRLRERET